MPLSLIKRLVIARKITPAEEDGNMTAIENAINGFAAQLAAALNPDGTIKPGSVNTAAIQDRAVTLVKLAFLSSFYAADAGAANAMVITWTPALTGYTAGLVFFVKAAATNTGATTLKVDALPVQNAKKFSGLVLSALSAGDIVAGNVYLLVHDGSEFLLLNPTPQSVSTGPVFLAAPTLVYPLGGATPETDFNAAAFVPAGAKAVILQSKQRWNSATDGDVISQIRADVLGVPLILGRAAGTDAVASCNQGIFPLTAGRHFLYVVTTTVPGVGETEITLIGYII